MAPPVHTYVPDTYIVSAQTHNAGGINEKSNDHVYNENILCIIVYRFVSLQTTESCHDGTSVEEGVLRSTAVPSLFDAVLQSAVAPIYTCTQTYQHPEQNIFRTRAWDG